jgi:muramoyltetrapeptide carboxypeptidase
MARRGSKWVPPKGLESMAEQTESGWVKARVIAPARSLSYLSDRIVSGATQQLRSIGITVNEGKRTRVIDYRHSSPIEYRLEDLHEAFRDPGVDLILVAIGGYNSIELLSKVDFPLIGRHPKPFCGFSDVTVLANAILECTGRSTLLGPNFATFAMPEEGAYMLSSFAHAVSGQTPYALEPAHFWTDDRWYDELQSPTFLPGEGFWPLQEGEADGTLVGGNLSSLCLLSGTGFLPNFEGKILLVEDRLYDRRYPLEELSRQLESLLMQPGGERLRGLLIGRFSRDPAIDRRLLTQIINSKQRLHGLPVIANVDFGHTSPIATLPIGGRARVVARRSGCSIVIDSVGSMLVSTVPFARLGGIERDTIASE